MPMFEILDRVRRAQGDICGAFGFGPNERYYQIVAETPHWRLRDYAAQETGPPLLIVAAPIKRPYIWDLAPSVSAISYCLDHGLRVYLLEWKPPPDDAGDTGLEAYANQAISEGLSVVLHAAGGAKPFLAGHSLGGTLAAIHAALEPQSMRGLILLSAPLCFRKGTSPFRDALVSMVPSHLSELSLVPGSLLSHVSAMAAPGTFVWSRLMDAALSMGEFAATDIHARVERWSLDEVALPGRLVGEILLWLYREDRFCQGTLPIGDRLIGPSNLKMPILAVVNSADEIVPRSAVLPFLEAVPGNDVRLLAYPGEVGVALQHVGILAGRAAYAHVWPQIITWIKERDGRALSSDGHVAPNS